MRGEAGEVDELVGEIGEVDELIREIESRVLCLSDFLAFSRLALVLGLALGLGLEPTLTLTLTLTLPVTLTLPLTLTRSIAAAVGPAGRRGFGPATCCCSARGTPAARA